HPGPDNLPPRPALLHTIPKDDTHLKHAVRMALRDQLLLAETWQSWLTQQGLKVPDVLAVADVALGVPRPEAAQFLLKNLDSERTALPVLALQGRHIARYGTDAVVAGLTTYIQDANPARMQARVELFKAMQKGLQESGRPLTKEARAVGSRLTATLLESSAANAVQSGMELAGSLRLTEFEPDLLRHLQNLKDLPALRQAA